MIRRFYVNFINGVNNFITATFHYLNDTDGLVEFYQGAAVTSSSVANPSVITTAQNHGLATGQTARIHGHYGSTPDINAEHIVTVISPTTFSIPVNVTAAGAGGYAGKKTEDHVVLSQVSAVLVSSYETPPVDRVG